METYRALMRRLETPPPALQTKVDMNPTLLVSWWCTIFSLIIIFIRLFGRWVRTERLFREDKVMFWSIVPLLGRMGLVHVILIWGTSNTVTTGLTLEQIHHREIGSKLVLPSRILYAAYIWIAKITIVEFLHRIIGQSWHRSYEIGARIIYGFLGLTFASVVISTLAECHPFNHYWQVVPDTGPHCRAALGQLITMGVCDIVTDVVLIAFPIPLVIMSRMPVRRKISLVMLFLLSVILIAITAYRIPSTIHRNASQQYRSLLASLEILAATGVSNVIVIGSFLRDRGVKKIKFRAASVDESVVSRKESRSRSIAQRHWGSDEDLVRDLGLSVKPDLQHGSTVSKTPRPAPAAPLSDVGLPRLSVTTTPINAGFSFNQQRRSVRKLKRSSNSSLSSTSTDLKLRDLSGDISEPESPTTTREKSQAGMSFFDVGGLVEESSPVSPSQDSESQTRHNHFRFPRAHAFLSDAGGLLSEPHRGDGAICSASTRADSVTYARDMLHPNDGRVVVRYGSSPQPTHRSERNSRGTSRHVSPLREPTNGPEDIVFSDAGGLLK